MAQLERRPSLERANDHTEFHEALIRDLELAQRTAKDPGMTHGPFTASEVGRFLRKELKARSKDIK